MKRCLICFLSNVINCVYLSKIFVCLASYLYHKMHEKKIKSEIHFKEMFVSTRMQNFSVVYVAAVVHYLLEENDSSMMTPLEFIDLYRKPFDTYLESGEFLVHRYTLFTVYNYF